MKMMSKIVLVFGALSLVSLGAFDVGALAQRDDKGFKPVVIKDWQAPDEKTIPQNMFGDYVRYGNSPFRY